MTTGPNPLARRERTATAADDSECRTGIVLAGGRSSRFGESDKALAELDGTPLLAHVVTRLDCVVDSVLVNCRPDQRSAFESVLDGLGASVRIVEDTTPDRGPAVGVRDALRACYTDRTAVVACDNPLVDPSFLAYLFECADDGLGIVPRFEGRLQPVQAVYRTEPLREACDATLAAGTRSLAAVVDELDPVVLPERTVRRLTTAESFTDVNTPADLERAHGASLDRPSIGRADAPT